MNKVPAITFYMIVAKYARAKGLKFFTVDQQKAAIEMYVIDAIQLN